MDPDFSGYATKAGLKCSDGRTITAGAFEKQDKMTVPLVWQHGHNTPGNILGHAVLENRADGVYTYGYFNDTDAGKNARALVEHGDIKALSIYANQLMEKSKSVLHGVIREVSLVLAGANPGAFIDFVRVAHSADDIETLEDEAVITTGLELEHSDKTVAPVVEAEETVEHADGEKTVADVYNSMTEEQKQVCNFMIGAALEAAADAPEDDTVSQSGTSTDSSDNNDEGDLVHKEDGMTRNVFDQDGAKDSGPTISHSDVKDIFADAQKRGSFKEAVADYALSHSITDIELMFPDAKSVTNDPQFVSRQMEWVNTVLNGAKHSPFAKVKTLLADITGDEARAKGYVKGNLKTEEVLVLLARTTSPTTIYKKQKLDRDDMLDITDMDVVGWLKAEMTLMIREELARAILVGDGRSNLSPDKVKDPAGATDGVGIRSVLHDADLYSVKATLAANVAAKDAVKGLVRARGQYRGSGKPTLFISDDFLTEIMLEEDKFGRALYATEQELQDKLRVSQIVTVDLFEEYDDLFAIMVSLSDYTIGANRGGELTSFEDFDIDYNQHKYLQETRLSGALTKPFSAVVVLRAQGTLAVATAPSFNGTTDEITVPVSAGVYYTINDVTVTGVKKITGPTEIVAHPADGNYLATNSTRSWTYAP
jgi:HK97 family phage prohead protease